LTRSHIVVGQIARENLPAAVKQQAQLVPQTPWLHVKQESRAVAREPRDAAAVLFGLKFDDDIHYKFKSSQTSKTRLQSSTRTGAK